MSTMNTQDIGIFPLFAWPLFRHKLNNTDQSNQAILKIVETEPLRTNQGNLIHNSIEILERPELADLKKQLLENINYYAKEVLCYVDVECQLLQSWINVTPPGMIHHIHSHRNSIISGTYYPFGTDKSPIVFHNPYEFQFVPNTDDTKQHPMGMISRNSVFVNPGPAELMLWLSPMSHEVRENKSENNRISLSFNVMLRGFIGHKESLSGVSL